MPRYKVPANPKTIDTPYDFHLRVPLPGPLSRKSHRQIAEDTGIAPSTVYRFLRDDSKLQRVHIARLMGTYGLAFDQLLELVIRVPQHKVRTLADGTLETITKLPANASRKLPPPDQQRTPPIELAGPLWEVQTVADKRAGKPPVQRKTTREEFNSYDPEPTDVHPGHPDDKSGEWTNPAWHWHEWRWLTRPGTEEGNRALPFNAANQRASAELNGNASSPAAHRAVEARGREIAQAMMSGQPIPPFDASNPAYVIPPAKRGGKKKAK